MRWQIHLLCLLYLACTPSNGSAPLNGAGLMPQSSESRHAPTATAPRNANLLGIPDRSDCGLPETLVSRGWPRELAPTTPTRPAPLEAGALTVAVLPDTQYYTLCRSPHFRSQAEWVASNKDALNLQAAFHLGDITETNTPAEWTFARTAMSPLWNNVPTFVATGNHDYGDDGTANRRFTLFPHYFNDPQPPTARALAETMTEGDLENAYYRVRLPHVTLGVLILEWSPRRDTVAWANHVLSKTEYSKDRVVFITHAYLYYDSTRYDWSKKREQQEWNPNAYGDHSADAQQAPDVYDGARLWQELVSRHPGVFLTLNGHVLGDGTGLLSSVGASGNTVHQVLVNYQMLRQGGLGYLRLIEFSPDGKTLRMRTYSPSLQQWATSDDQNFDLTVAPPLW